MSSSRVPFLTFTFSRTTPTAIVRWASKALAKRTQRRATSHSLGVIMLSAGRGKTIRRKEKTEGTGKLLLRHFPALIEVKRHCPNLFFAAISLFCDFFECVFCLETPETRSEREHRSRKWFHHSGGAVFAAPYFPPARL